MSKLNLKKMVGPLPVGAWLAVVVVGVAVSYWLKSRSTSILGGAPTATDAAAADTGYGGVGGLLGGTGVGGSGDTLGLVPVASGPTTNSEWVSFATKMLVAAGRPEGAFAIQQALARYVSGLYTLSTAERVIVEQALRQVGNPPEGAPIIPTSTPGATPVTPAPTTVPKPVPVGGLYPVTGAGKDPKLGTRRTTITKPESAGSLAHRLYRSSNNYNYIIFFNQSKFPPKAGGSSLAQVPTGGSTVIAY